MESQRIEGNAHPIPKTVVYLGNQTQAIAVLESSDYPSKERMLSQVREAAPATGKNKGKQGRPRKIEISGTVLSQPEVQNDN